MSLRNEFTKRNLVCLLENALNRTLGEVDVNNVFDKTLKHPKITGIAGDVIEQSVLGYPADNRQEPDLVVDGDLIELKTTGLRYSVKNSAVFEAKEPMSITAVSPENITSEVFENSKFWHKLEKLLFVYYLYDSKTTVTASEYANFPVKGYQFYEFNEEDREILQHDWELIRDFIKDLQCNYIDYKAEYPRISSELRNSLLFIDTAPKWPNPPRFRLKRQVVTNIVQEHFAGKLEQLPTSYKSYEEIDVKCLEIVNKYGNNTIGQLMSSFDLTQEKVNKSIAEKIVVRMFGGTVKKMNRIDLFNKIGLVGKTITLTKDGLRTEDMKLFAINFEELTNPELKFEDSEFYDYFRNHQILCIIFEEPSSKAALTENKFVKFRRLSFSDEFISEHVETLWNEMRRLIFNNELVDVIRYDKNGLPRVNKKTSVVQSSPNFPKAKSHITFVRGSGKDSAKKTEQINGINMYKQYVWIKGSVISEMIAQKMNKDT